MLCLKTNVFLPETLKLAWWLAQWSRGVHLVCASMWQRTGLQRPGRTNERTNESSKRRNNLECPVKSPYKAISLWRTFCHGEVWGVLSHCLIHFVMSGNATLPIVRHRATTCEKNPYKFYIAVCFYVRQKCGRCKHYFFLKNLGTRGRVVDRPESIKHTPMLCAYE